MNALLLIPLAAALAGQPESLVSFGREVNVPAGVVVKEVVAIGGAVRIDGQTRQSVIVIGGPVRVEGIIGDDLVVIGSAELGPKAIVDGELVVIGGTLKTDPGARIKGDRTAVTVMNKTSQIFAWPFAWMADWFNDGFVRLRAFPASFPWAWGLLLAVLLSYVALAALAPKAVESCASALERQPIQALLAGVLALSFLGPLSLLFVISVAGIALLPALLAVAIIASWIGKAGLLLQIGHQSSGGKVSALKVPAAVALGGLEVSLLYAIPGVGLAVWGLLSAWGFGAALIAALEAARREPPPAGAPASKEEPFMSLAGDRAGFWPRAAALAIDCFAVAVIAAITPILTFGIFAWAAYQIAMWTWKGTTLGGILVGLRGVRLDGRPMDLTVAVVRHLASYLSAFACFLGFIWAAWDPEGQTWHDKLAGTIVVRTPKAQPLV